MMGHFHKTDKLDAGGLATLFHLGTLPAVWIPPADLRDERELPRTRIVNTGFECPQNTGLRCPLFIG